MRLTLITLGSLSICVLVATRGYTQDANLVKNGDWEKPKVDDLFVAYSAGADVAGWKVESGTIHLCGPSWMAAAGCQSAKLLGASGTAGPAAVCQDLATQRDQRYRVRFAVSGDPEDGQLEVWWGGTLLDVVEFSTEGRGNTGMRWEFREYVATATSATTRLTFRAQSASASGPMIDVVSVVPAEGVMESVEQDVAVLIYLHTNGGTFSLDDVEEIKGAAEDAKAFFERNSFMRYTVNLTFFIMDGYHDIVKEDGAIPPELVDAQLRVRGFRDHEYDGVIVVAPGSGCLAWGTHCVLGTGSYCQTGFWGRRHTAWTIVHEYDHLRDSQFEAFDFRDYPFNHPGVNRHLIGVTGPDWSVVADISRRWLHWLALGTFPESRWGRLIFTYDRDGDGVPNDDARFALDERRFGSNRGARDSDGDGLDDLGELTAGILSSSNPNKPDTDGDGLLDGADLYPLYPLRPDIRYRSLSPTAPLEERTLLGCYCHSHPIHPLCFYANWDSNYLHLALRMSTDLEPERLHLYTDNNDNGLFHGRDNYYFEVNVAKGSLARQELWDADIPEPEDHWVYEMNEAIGLRVLRDEASTAVLLAVPKSEDYGLHLKPGERLGIRVVVETAGGRLELVEPCMYLRVTLAAEQDAVYSEGFESLEGWQATGLWHTTSATCVDCFGFGGRYAYYGRDETCTYEVRGRLGSSVRTQGTLTSPVIKVPQNTTLTIVFNSFREVENNRRATLDRTYVQIRQGREQRGRISWTGWRTIWARSSRDASPECATVSYPSSTVPGPGSSQDADLIAS